MEPFLRPPSFSFGLRSHQWHPTGILFLLFCLVSVPPTEKTALEAPKFSRIRSLSSLGSLSSMRRPFWAPQCFSELPLTFPTEGWCRPWPWPRGDPARGGGGLTSCHSRAGCPKQPGPSLNLFFPQFLETWVLDHQPCQICMCLSGRTVNCTSQPCSTARGELRPTCCSGEISST